MVVLDTDGLAKQDKEALDLKTLAADTPEVISRQVIFINNLFINSYTSWKDIFESKVLTIS